MSRPLPVFAALALSVAPFALGLAASAAGCSSSSNDDALVGFPEGPGEAGVRDDGGSTAAADGGGAGGGEGGTADVAFDTGPAVVPMTCAWLSDPNGCWRQAIDAVRACDTGQDPSGSFSDNLSSCTYGSGSLVTFPLAPQQPLQATDVDFERSNGDGTGTCFSFDAQSGHDRAFEIMTAKGTVLFVQDKNAATITCPDGHAAHTDDLPTLWQSCAPNAPVVLEGTSTDGTTLTCTFAAPPDPDGGTDAITADGFSCSVPQ